VLFLAEQSRPVLYGQCAIKSKSFLSSSSFNLQGPVKLILSLVAVPEKRKPEVTQNFLYAITVRLIIIIIIIIMYFYAFQKHTYCNCPRKAKKTACPWDQADQNLTNKRNRTQYCK
ncbi:MAG: hypothetical protein O7C56_09925, partial [Rickettsia endosymbiont of Ixodes persulcatus]|nr:hypothetical protein [Rickettsia endosymbiont of Ixodes persulcatus]